MRFVTKKDDPESTVGLVETTGGVDVVINGYVVLMFKNGSDTVHLISAVDPEHTGLRVDDEGCIVTDFYK